MPFLLLNLRAESSGHDLGFFAFYQQFFWQAYTRYKFSVQLSSFLALEGFFKFTQNSEGAWTLYLRLTNHLFLCDCCATVTALSFPQS
jgi:hypothetical protein